jgi:hypothetical protein
MQINQLHLKVLLDLANQLQQEVIDCHQTIQRLDAECKKLRLDLEDTRHAAALPNGHPSTAVTPTTHEDR